MTIKELKEKLKEVSELDLDLPKHREIYDKEVETPIIEALSQGMEVYPQTLEIEEALSLIPILVLMIQVGWKEQINLYRELCKYAGREFIEIEEI